MNLTVREVTAAIMAMNSREDLAKVLDAYKAAQYHVAHAAVLNLSEGTTVEFQARQGLKLRGKIVKMNKKTVVVDVKEGARPGKWNVTASLVTPVAEGQS